MDGHGPPGRGIKPLPPSGAPNHDPPRRQNAAGGTTARPKTPARQFARVQISCLIAYSQTGLPRSKTNGPVFEIASRRKPRS